MAGCVWADEQVILLPEASYLNGKRVSAVPAAQSVTLVGSPVDEAGREVASYPTSPGGRAHKIVHLSPVPSRIALKCERVDIEELNPASAMKIRKYTELRSEVALTAGKTYKVFCNALDDRRVRGAIRIVPNGTKYRVAD